MGSCITKPAHSHRRPSVVLGPFSVSSASYVPPVASGPVQSDQSQEILLAVSEEGEIAPFRVGNSEGEMEYSDSEVERWEHSAEDISLRDSLEILREERRCKEQMTAFSTVSKAKEEIAHLNQAIKALKSSPARSFTCFMCETGRPKVLFLPCRHVVCCRSCSPQASLCPACRHTIFTREEVFL